MLTDMPLRPSTTQVSEQVSDVGRLLDYGPWTGLQKLVLALAAISIVFDGFDIQLLAFSLPSLMKEWHVGRAAFGPALAAGLIAMSLGTAAAGFLGDRIGRRWALIGSVLWFGLMTVATAFVHDVSSLLVMRFLAGLGLGGAVPNATAMSAEFTPLRRRPLAVAATIVCVPLGGAVAGAISSRILGTLGWQYLFVIGGVSAIVLAVLLTFTLPESARYLIRRPARRAELSRLLTRMGRSVPDGVRLADLKEESKEAVGVAQALFGQAAIRNTLSLWVCFLGSMLSVYIALNWLPALLSSRGFTLSQTSSGLAVYNFGGVFGALVCAALIYRLGSQLAMTGAALLAMASALYLLSVPPTPAAGLPLIALAINGFFVNAIQSAMYALTAHVYPTSVRGRGLAAAAAIGRTGAVLSALVGAALVQAGTSVYFGTMACALVLPVIGLTLITDHIPRFKPDES